MSSRNVILKRIFDSEWWRGIFCLVETVFSYLKCFLVQVETFTEIGGSKFIWERICSGRKGFSTQWKLFFFHSLLLSCKLKPLLKLVEASSLYFLKMAVPNV